MLADIYQLLLEEFGEQGWWPDPDYHPGRYDVNDPFEICVGAILTQNTSWKNVEKAIKALKEQGLLDKEKIRMISQERLAQIIRSSGYHHQKARKLKEFVSFDGEVTRENLLSVWGIGKETADSILLYAYQQPTFVVDAYTRRILARVGLTDGHADYDEIQEFFHKNLKKDHKLFNEFHALLVKLAKEFCKKRPACDGCPIEKRCKKNQ